MKRGWVVILCLGLAVGLMKSSVNLVWAYCDGYATCGVRKKICSNPDDPNDCHYECDISGQLSNGCWVSGGTCGTYGCADCMVDNCGDPPPVFLPTATPVPGQPTPTGGGGGVTICVCGSCWSYPQGTSYNDSCGQSVCTGCGTIPASAGREYIYFFEDSNQDGLWNPGEAQIPLGVGDTRIEGGLIEWWGGQDSLGSGSLGVGASGSQDSRRSPRHFRSGGDFAAARCLHRRTGRKPVSPGHGAASRSPAALAPGGATGGGARDA